MKTNLIKSQQNVTKIKKYIHHDDVQVDLIYHNEIYIYSCYIE